MIASLPLQCYGIFIRCIRAFCVSIRVTLFQKDRRNGKRTSDKKPVSVLSTEFSAVNKRSCINVDSV